MPDSTWEKNPFDDLNANVARVIRNGETTLTLLMRWDRERSCYVIWEEGSDETLEYSDVIDTIYRLADMYLEGFREGYDRGYAARDAEHLDPVVVPDPYRIRRNPGSFTRPTESDGRNRIDGEGSAEGDRPGR
jgi:hypothetical protein